MFSYDVAKDDQADDERTLAKVYKKPSCG